MGALQWSLNRAGHGQSLAVDSVFTSLTEEAVKAFQVMNGLVADGIAGPKTREALGL